MKDTKEIAKDYTERNDIPLGTAYNDKGKVPTHKPSNKVSYERTYNDKGEELTLYQYTYDDRGQLIKTVLMSGMSAPTTTKANG